MTFDAARVGLHFLNVLRTIYARALYHSECDICDSDILGKVCRTLAAATAVLFD